jgi:hypothetical protein
MSNIDVFHLTWERICWDDFTPDKYMNKEDYGLYQVYGTHPVYGEDKLLYIGKAQLQTFGVRLSQHWDFDVNYFPQFSRIHLGRFILRDSITYETWGDAIDKIEKTLILANCPAFNAESIKGLLDSKVVGNFIVLNWGDYGSILSETSSLKYSNKYWEKKDILLKEKK